MFRSRSRALVALVFFVIGTAFGTGPARAANELATGEAFDVLLSMPQGLPEENAFPVWGVGEAPADEEGLKDALKDLFAEGADVNAYRHGGTMLHHALRAGLQDTSLWLLAHGANPRLEVQSDAIGRTEGDDALQLAILYRRWRVVDALLRRPGLAPTTDRDRAFRWLALIDEQAPQDAMEVAVRQLEARIALPGDWYGGCLLAAAENRSIVPLILRSTAREKRWSTEENKALQGRDRDIAWTCPSTSPSHVHAAKGVGVAGLPASELARADARRAEPLLPVLVPMLATEADVHAWSTLPLRRPWQDGAFTRTVIQALLRTEMPAATRTAALRSVPKAALPAALDDDETLNAWFAWVATLPLPQAAEAAAGVDDASLLRHAGAALSGFGRRQMGYGEGVPAASPAVWKTLLERLPAPFARPGTLGVATLMPEAYWPMLFARGYKPPDDDLLALWHTSTPEAWRRRWPLLQAAATPEAQSSALGYLLGEAKRKCDYDQSAVAPWDVEKLALMVASGVRPPQVVALSLDCALRTDPVALKALIATGLATAPAVTTGAAPRTRTEAPPAGLVPDVRFVADHIACMPEPDPAIVKAAIHLQFASDENGHPARADTASDVLQPVEEPGSRACAWLVSGGWVTSRFSEHYESFYSGQEEETGCGEGKLHGNLWRMADGRLVTVAADEGATAGLLPLKEASGGRRFMLALPVEGSCGAGAPGFLFEWSRDASGPRFSALPQGDPARLAFARQCPLEDPGPCFGLESSRSGFEAPPAQPAKIMFAGMELVEKPLPLADFVDRYGKGMREHWIAAFLALDVAALQEVGADIWPAWRPAALASLTASSMSLQQKRQRVAWMFRDRNGMAASFGQGSTVPEVIDLVAWLPPEDWRPMLVAIGHDDMMLQRLRDAAQKKGDTRLACTFARAARLPCDAPAS
jgi:hypothetical protein